MRKQFVATTTRLLEQNPKVIVLLGDISVFAFKEAAQRFPGRVLNVGVNEQAMIGMGAGLARAGFYPIMHTIDPFCVGRVYEQIKVDFAYQGLSGAIVTCGASTDYSALGPTHHGPESVALMLTIPGARIHVPGHIGEVDRILEAAPHQSGVSYIRLSEDQNPEALPAAKVYGVTTTAEVLVIAVGPSMRHCLLIDTHAYDTAVLYLETVQPFPWLTVQNTKPKKVLIVEPFYEGTLCHLVSEALYPEPVVIRSVGIHRQFCREYGTRAHLDHTLGMTAANVALQLDMLRSA